MKIRSDFMEDRKSIHVGLRKEVYLEFRKKMFDMNITIQAALEEFCKLVVADYAPATRMLEKISLAIVKGEIEKYYSKSKKNDKIDALDHDALYNLINQKLKETDDEISDAEID